MPPPTRLLDRDDALNLSSTDRFRRTAMNDLNDFQTECERRVRDLLDHRGLRIQERSITGSTDKYVHVVVGDSNVDIWIYHDEAEYRLGERHYNFEMSYYQDEDRLFDDFLAALGEDLAGGR